MTPELEKFFDQLEAAALQSVVGLTPPDLYDLVARVRREVERTGRVVAVRPSKLEAAE